MSARSVAARIGAILRGSWATFWIFALPKDVWGMLCIWPTLFLAVACYAWEPGGAGVRLMVLAALWDVVLGFWLTTSAMKVSRDALARTVATLRDCTYTPVPWSRILRGNDPALIEETSLISFMGRQGLPYDHGKDVRLFRVDIGDSGVIPGGLGVFNIPFTESVILLRDDPEDADIEERFCLYHELGHTLGNEFTVQSALRKGVKLPFATLVLGAAALPMTRTSLLVLGLCLVSLWQVRNILVRRGKSIRAISEMRADQFAIRFLDEAERRYVLEHPEDVLPNDSELSPLENVARVGAARLCLETGEALADSDRSTSQWSFFLDMQLAALGLAAWMVLLASFIGAPGAHLVQAFPWLIAGTYAVALLRYAIHFWKGRMIEMVFSGRVTWHDGTFGTQREHLSRNTVVTT